jgi:hypothetical protein
MEQHLLVEPLGNASRLEVLEGPTGRKTWPDNLKGRIVAESFEPGVRVADMARKHGMPLDLCDDPAGLVPGCRLILELAVDALNAFWWTPISDSLPGSLS